MNWVIRVIGIVFILMAIGYLLKPDVIRRLIGFFAQGNRLYLAGLMRFILAVIFLVAARECRKPWVIFAFGILFLLGGLLIFLIGPKKLRPVLEWWQKRSNLLLRVLALATLAVGVVVVIFA
jgi:uncharacterized protein YjeT (DUF2065 family)